MGRGGGVSWFFCGGGVFKKIKKKSVSFFFWGGGGGGGSGGGFFVAGRGLGKLMLYNTKKQPSTQCRACGTTINTIHFEIC